MKVTSKAKAPKVDIAQAQRILKAAKGYRELKKKLDDLISYGLKSESITEKNETLRALRILL